MIKRTFSVFFCIHILSFYSFSQNRNISDTARYLTLDQCLVYALQNQPSLKQYIICISIARASNNIALSAWLPQVNLNANLTHYYSLPKALEANPANPTGPEIAVQTGVYNTAMPQLSASETIFNPDLLYAAKSAHLYIEQAKQANDSTKINVIATVSKSFYNLLLTLEQITVLKEDTVLLAKNLKDAYNQYLGGIVDKSDYKEATISLNNTRAQLKQAEENVFPQYASLKQQMGYPPEKNFNVSFDTSQIEQQIA